MKKIYKSIKTIVILFSIISYELGAQALSGTVTINSGQATGGTNYQTFSVLATALNSNGVNGPLVINVAPNSGPYIDQIQLNTIPGASAVNAITINGNNNVLSWTSNTSSTPWTIGLSGCSYLRVNNLNIWGLGIYAYPLKIWNNSNYNIFTACTFSVPFGSTSTNQIPISFSGSGTTYAAYGMCGNFNVIQTSTISNGYMGVSFYGASSYNCTNDQNPKGNQLLNNQILDYYTYGIYNYYFLTGTVIKGNVIKCPNINVHTSRYAIYSYYTNSFIIDGNFISNPFVTNVAYTGSFFGMYLNYGLDSYGYGCSYPSRYPMFVRNNIISDINSNGAIYGIYFYGADGYVYNNTISLDQTNSSSSTTYGFYLYGYQANYRSIVQNNIVSITRGGSGTKYGLYQACGCTGTDVDISKNDIYMNAASGTNYYGYVTSFALQTNYAGWASQVTSGFSVNPTFTNMTAFDYHPTNTVIANQSIPYPSPNNLIYDQMNAVRNPTAPDVGALEFSQPACIGTPTGVTLTGPNYLLCPGENATLALGNINSAALTGLNYSWNSSSTSSIGPWTPINGANGLAYTTPPAFGTTYYQFVMTCTNPGGGSSSPVVALNVAGTSQSVVPYFEGFEQIGMNNRLPNCSWQSPNLGNTAFTNTSAASGYRLPYQGASFAYFSNSTPGTSYYYSNGIQLYAGITYSASLWFMTEALNGYANWTDLSILVGLNQNPGGQIQVASTGNAAIALQYKSLSNTFTVPSSGIYYACVRATSQSGGSPYLSWDNLQIIAPCTIPANSPSMTVTTNNSIICSGNSANITANGANSYLWSTGSTSAAISVTPGTTTLYSVIGTSTLTSCSNTITQLITVNQSPQISIQAQPPVICSGKSANLIANGATTYTWNTGANGPVVNVSPQTSTSYTVQGKGTTNNCAGTAVFMMNVNPSPNITGNASSPQICVGETATLIGTAAGGGAGYSWSWISPNLNIASPVAYLVGSSSYLGVTVYTVTGIDPNGCSGTYSVALGVVACTGIKTLSSSDVVNVYPNPNSGAFSVELNNGLLKNMELHDVTGRIISSINSIDSKIDFDLNNVSSGIYFLHVKTESSNSIIKIVKQ